MSDQSVDQIETEDGACLLDLYKFGPEYVSPPEERRAMIRLSTQVVCLNCRRSSSVLLVGSDQASLVEQVVAFRYPTTRREELPTAWLRSINDRAFRLRGRVQVALGAVSFQTAMALKLLTMPNELFTEGAFPAPAMRSREAMAMIEYAASHIWRDVTSWEDATSMLRSVERLLSRSA